MKKRLQTLAFLVLLQFLCINLFGQNKLIPFFSGAAMHHLGRGGVNIELGAEYEIFKHLGVSTNYRYSFVSNKSKNWVNISTVALNLSWIVVNRNNNRFSVSTGLTSGRYRSLYHNSMDIYFPVRERDYYDTWWNPFKVQYDYTFSNNVMFGTFISFFGDDGDDSNLLGFIVGYRL